MQLYAIAQGVSQLPLKGRLDDLVAQVQRVLEEGRQSVTGLRSDSTCSGESLEVTLARDAEALRANGAIDGAIDLRIIVGGKQRPLHPFVRIEVYRVAREALVNALRHARAMHVEVEIEYGSSDLTVKVRDDGQGIDPKILDEGRAGHWGITGMRERAERLGGALTLWSRGQAGTEIELRVPASTAFQSTSASGLATKRAEPRSPWNGEPGAHPLVRRKD
jgi:signal transduction histidine kinase